MKNKGTMQAVIRTIPFCITARRIHTVGLYLILKGIVKISLLLGSPMTSLAGIIRPLLHKHLHQ